MQCCLLPFSSSTGAPVFLVRLNTHTLMHLSDSFNNRISIWCCYRLPGFELFVYFLRKRAIRPFCQCQIALAHVRFFCRKVENE